MKHFGFFVFLIFSLSSYAQQLTQTIKGRVLDKITEEGLPGASVLVENSDPLLGSAADIDGYFKIENVPVGRVTLKVNYLGYEPILMPNLVVGSAKELILEIKMEESINQMTQVVVEAEKSKARAQNDMAFVSARSFSVEETQRFAGSWQDPARAAAAYAGVSGGSDERNDIIIRGNSPTALLWRLEGINIPNPNHLSFFGSTGGPVSILNNNVLANSDFFTGAFPAEYGNATGGVFDLNLRRGNYDKREYYAQIGLNGLELGIEGPFAKEKSKASYLASYRYSTMKLLSLMNVDFGIDAVPEYQDLTFAIDVPYGKKGANVSVWGIGGLSGILVDETGGFYSSPPVRESQEITSDMGVVGVSHSIPLGEKSKLKSTLAVSGSQQGNIVNEIDSNDIAKLTGYSRNSIVTVSIHERLNTKLNAKNSLRFGLVADQYLNYLSDSVYDPDNDIFDVLLDQRNEMALLQGYAQWLHRFNMQFHMSAGVHYQYLIMNNTNAIEPRIGFQWNINSKHSISFGSGLHSQTQSIAAYFVKTYDPIANQEVQTNKNLDFSKSTHGIIGHNWNFAQHFRLKTDVYYQYLFDVPVAHVPSHYSLTNLGEAIGSLNLQDSLVNDGTGTNYGIEFTLEKFLSSGYYFLLTTSLYEAKYTASDGIQRNNAFNGNFNLTLLGGYELPVWENHRITFDTKISWAGGRRIIPVDLDSSRTVGYPVFIYERAYEEQLPDYFRADFKLGMRLNYKKTSHTFSVDLQNVLNTKNIFSRFYDPQQGDIVTSYQLGFLPLVFYKIDF